MFIHNNFFFVIKRFSHKGTFIKDVLINIVAAGVRERQFLTEDVTIHHEGGCLF